MQKKLIKQCIAVLFTLAMVLLLLPETLTSLFAEDNTGGFELSLNWNDNDDKEHFIYETNQSDSRVVRLNVRYANKKVPEGHEKGSVIITVPGIGNAGRGTVIGASSVAADRASNSSKQYAWSYTYDSRSDMYTFTNNNNISVNNNFSGSFEILWTVDARSSVHNYKEELEAVLYTQKDHVVTSNMVTYEQMRVKDDYKIEVDVSTREYRGEGLDNSIDPDDYWWVNYRTVSSLNRRSLGVMDSHFQILLPQGAQLRSAKGGYQASELSGQSYTKTGMTDTIGGLTYDIWQVNLTAHHETYTSRYLEFVVIYPKSTFPGGPGNDITIHSRIRGTYYDLNEGEETLAQDSVSVAVNEYPFPVYTGEILYARKTGTGTGRRTQFAYNFGTHPYDYGYIDSRHIRNGKKEYNYTLTGGVVYPKLTNGNYDIYDLELIDEKVEVLTRTGAYRQMADGEYEITSLTIPGNSSIVNQNGNPIAPCDVEIYYKTQLNGLYVRENKYQVQSGSQKINLPSGTVGVRVEFLGLQESIDVSVPMTMIFHSDADEIVTDGGQLINTLSAYAYAYSTATGAVGTVPLQQRTTANTVETENIEPAEEEQIDADEQDEEEKSDEEDIADEEETSDDPETEDAPDGADTEDIKETPEEQGDPEPEDAPENKPQSQAAQKKLSEGVGLFDTSYREWSIGPYNAPFRFYILERPNFYYNTTYLMPFDDYVSKWSGLPSTFRMDTSFDYLEEEELRRFSMYTILPENLVLGEGIVDAETLYEQVSLSSSIGRSSDVVKNAMTIEVDTNYQNSGRVRVEFHFDLGSSAVTEPNGSVSVSFPVVATGNNLFRYGVDHTVRGVSVIEDEDIITMPSSGYAVDNGSYANLDERNLWSDINGNQDTTEKISQSTYRRTKTSIAVAFEEGITKLVATETEGGRFTIPSRQEAGDGSVTYEESEIPLAEMGSAYSYKLRVNPQADANQSYAANLILMDALETSANAAWQGTFVSVDATEAENILSVENGSEVKAEIYYSGTDYSAAMANDNYRPNLATSDWTKIQPAVVKTIAVTFGDAKLSGDQQISVTVNMTAPMNSSFVGEITENRTAVYYETYAADDSPLQEDWLPSNPVPVKLTPKLIKLIIEKVDADSGNEDPIAGIKFDLYQQMGSNPDPNGVDIRLYTDLTTNSKGQITVSKFPEGTYYLIEKTADRGYEKIDDPIILDVSTQDDETEFHATVKNKRKPGEITLKKVSDLNSSTVLEGAKFDLYTADGTKLNSDNDSYITDQNGEITVSGLEWGDYYFVEREAPEGYTIEEEGKQYSFTIDSDTDAGRLVNLNVENAQIPAAVLLVKFDETVLGERTEGTLAGAFYRLYKKDGTSDGKEIGIYRGNNKGEIYVDDLEFGDYYFVETISPKGYNLNEDKIEFSLEPGHTADDPLEVKTWDKRKAGDVLIYKQDDNGDYVNGAEYILEYFNEETKEYELYKPEVGYDNPLNSGEKIVDNEPIGEGVLIFDNLEWGKYRVKETKAPRGYELSDEEYTFEINADNAGERFYFNVVDKQKKGILRLIKICKDGDEEVLQDRLNGAVFNLYRTDGTLVRSNLVTGPTAENQDQETGILLIENLEWGSYYLEEIKAPDNYGLSGEKIRFSVNSLTAGIIQEITVENPIQTATIILTKRISTDDIVFAHGNPSFVFKLVDGDDKEWYRSVVFDENYVEINKENGYVEISTIFTGLPAGTYIASEVEVVRYEFDSIIEKSSNADITGETVIFTLTGDEEEYATFVNIKVDQDDTSDNVQINNIVKAKQKLTAIIGEYTGGSIPADTTFDRESLEVMAVYDDGTDKGVDSDKYDLYIQQEDGLGGLTWVPWDEEIPEDWLGAYTIKVEHQDSGITKTTIVTIEVIAPVHFMWHINDNQEAIIYAYKGSLTTVEFPSEVAGRWIDDKYINDGNIYRVTGIEGNVDNNILSTHKINPNSVEKVIFPDDIVSIGDYAFYNYRSHNSQGENVREMELPPDVKYIGESAFQSSMCLKVNGIFPDTVEYIGKYAFNGSYIGWHLNLGENLTYIGDGAFSGCEDITGDVYISDSVEYLGATAFYNCKSLNGELTIGTGITEIGSYAFYRCWSLKGSLIIPDTIEYIGSMAFNGCDELNGTLKLSENLETIEMGTFSGCKGLVGDVIIPDNVTFIDGNAFYQCSGFDKELVIGAQVTEIGGNAFSSCGRIKKLTFRGNKIEKLGGAAFYGLTAVEKEVKIPASISGIGTDAFTNFGWSGGGKILFPTSIDYTTYNNYPFGLTDGVNIGTYDPNE